MTLRDLLRDPVRGPLTCDVCQRFVSVAKAKLSHEYGDYGSILSTEVLCPRCAAGPLVVKPHNQADDQG